MRNVDILVGGQYGSEGKGNIVSAIAKNYDIMVRTGGPNAGHKVKLNGKVYCFRHLPSGALHNPNALLVLGPGAVIRIPVLMKEIEDTGVVRDRIIIDPRACIITDSDIEEEKLTLAHLSSTTQGVGSATACKVMRAAKLALDYQEQLHDLGFILNSRAALNHNNPATKTAKILIEGTQGTMLSIHHGYYPWVTSRDTIAAALLAEAGLPPSRVNRVFVVFRSFPIRVAGQSGPMPEEMTWEQISEISGIPTEVLKEKEHTSTTHRLRRVSRFSVAEFRAACELNGPTDLVLTFADYLGGEANIETRVGVMQSASYGVPVSMISRGFGPECVTITNKIAT